MDRNAKMDPVTKKTSVDLLTDIPIGCALMSDTENHIRVIVDRFGGPTALARLLGCGQATVSDWISHRNVPNRRIIEVIRLGASMKPKVKLKTDDFFVLDNVD